MRISSDFAVCNAFLASGDLPLHQRLLLNIFLVPLRRFSPFFRLGFSSCVLVRLSGFLPDAFCLLLCSRSSRRALHSILMHCLQRSRYAEVDQICIYGVLEVPSSVVGEEYVDRFATGI